jgi:Spy/CpxP family protein refolding chaperone
MKRFIEGFLAVCVLAACASLFAQTAPARKTAPPPAKEAAGPKEPGKTRQGRSRLHKTDGAIH